jgi:hexulose-6-phosphate isomerase
VHLLARKFADLKRLRKSDGDNCDRRMKPAAVLTHSTGLVDRCMITAINYWSFERGLSNEHPIRESAIQARAAGFEAIELAIAESGVLSVTSSLADCRRIRADVESIGLRLELIASGMTWGCSPSHPDPNIRCKAIELQKAALQRVAWLGCTSMLFIPGAVCIPSDRNYPFVPYEDAIRWAREATQILVKTAESVKVELCIENVWNGMFYSPLEYRDFIDSFASTAVRAYLDVGNCMGQHQYPPHWVQILDSRIGRVHLKDFKRAIGNLDGFCDLLGGTSLGRRRWQRCEQPAIKGRLPRK